MAISNERHLAFTQDRTRLSHYDCRRGADVRRQNVSRVWAHIILAALALVSLIACDRDTELALRSKLNQWFHLGQTAYFVSQSRCTGAMINVTVDRPRPIMPVQTDLELAKDALHTSGVAALRIDGMTPAELTDALLLSGTGEFGKQALAAAALAVSCFQGTEIGGFLYEALNRPGATLAYEMHNGGLMILDPDKKRLFYVAGDVW